jgi:hypothetical protein
MDDSSFLAQLDKIGIGAPRPQPVSRPAFWQGPSQAGKADDEGTAHGEQTTDFEAIEEIADIEAIATIEPADAPAPPPLVWPEPQRAATDSKPVPSYTAAAGVPRRLAALVIVLGVCAGAGGAAFMLHDRVEQIVAAWTNAAR